MINDLYKNGFFAPPRSLFLDSDENMTAYAKLVLLCLHSHRNDVNFMCNPSQNTIAKECKISVRSVSDAIQLLIELGYIAIDHTRSKHTNAYVFLFDIPHPNAAPVADTAPIADKQQNNQSVVFNNTTTCEQPVTRCSGNDLIFDCNLHNAEPAFISFATALLEGIPDAQKILDELNFQIGEKKQQGTPIRNLQGYLVKLAKLNATGEFVPSGSLEIEARRKARHARKPVAVAAAVTPKPEQPAVLASPVQDSAKKEPSNVGRSHLDSLRKNLGMKPKDENVPSETAKQAMSAALVNMASGRRGGGGFQAIGKLIRGEHEA